MTEITICLRKTQKQEAFSVFEGELLHLLIYILEAVMANINIISVSRHNFNLHLVPIVKSS